MSVKVERDAAVAACIGGIRDIFSAGVTVETMNQAKASLMALCARQELFPRSDFPLPDEGETERTFLIGRDDDGGYALYVNSGRPGQSYRPHDHGGSWAIVAAVSGAERHGLYRRTDDGSSLEAAQVEQVGTIDVQPGTAVSMLPDGIHSIEALGDEPLLHLHLYGRAFEHQSERFEFEPSESRGYQFQLENFGHIEDAR